MSFVSTDPQGHKGKTDIWLTPLPLIKKLGKFDMDPCGFKGHKTAKKIISPPNDGLNIKWRGRVWLNPPYSEASHWLQKAHQEYKEGNIKSCVALMFVRTDNKMMQENLKNWHYFILLPGRISFINGHTMETLHNAGAPSMLMFMGEKPPKINGVILKRI